LCYLVTCDSDGSFDGAFTLQVLASKVLCWRRGYTLSMKAAAIFLIAIGIGVVVWGAFGFKTREKVIDVGPIHASKDETHNVPYGPVAGAILAIGGVVLLVKSKA
jgi:uncharacterized membrane protein YidH (DUF202 family)